jgi:hypothetical protein
MLAYINDFAMMMLVVLLAMPVLLLIRRQAPRPAGASAD